MTHSLLLLATLLAANPPVTITRLDESTQAGTLAALDGTQARIAPDSAPGDAADVPIADLRSLTFPGVTPPSPHDDPPATDVILIDGSRLAGKQVTVSRQDVRLDSESFRELTIPLPQVRSLRLGPIDAKVATRWNELHARENPSDLLVVRKQDLLDFVEGSVGEITDKQVTFLLNGNSVSVPRERAFGVIYAHRPAPRESATAQVQTGRNRLNVGECLLDGDNFRLKLLSGLSLQVAADRVHLIEFAGRIRYLEDLEAVVSYPEGITDLEKLWHFRRGTASNGAPLKIGAEESITRRGLWLHSGVTVRYRINRDFRRLAGLVGMDHNVRGNKAVQLVIVGDGRTLFDRKIAWSEEALPLDLDVEGVRDLEIRVERLPEFVSTDLFATQEHLSLGDLRVIR